MDNISHSFMPPVCPPLCFYDTCVCLCRDFVCVWFVCVCVCVCVSVRLYVCVCVVCCVSRVLLATLPPAGPPPRTPTSHDSWPDFSCRDEALGPRWFFLFLTHTHRTHTHTSTHTIYLHALSSAPCSCCPRNCLESAAHSRPSHPLLSAT